jgi:tetratricopeptide (TPR) repeat protein
MDTDKRAVYEFGDFILESGRRRLLRRDSREPIALTAKAFDTLLHLIEHRGETLDKDTLLATIWPGVVVEENSPPGSFGDVGQALALSGRRAEALAELDRVLKLSTQRYVSAGDIASIYASLGDTENALAWLDRALQQRASMLGFLAQNPAFDGLHDDPRFAAIVDRVGLWKVAK